MRPLLQLSATALALSLVGALDITLKSVECDESLPIYVKGMTIECAGEARCSLGSEATLYGNFQYVGVEDVGLVDGFAFVSANLDFLSVQFQLLQYLQAPICGQYVTEDPNSEDECPADGIYEFYLPYVLPEEETKATWLASGWEGIGRVGVYSEANNADSLIGDCELFFATAATKPSGHSVLSKVPIPSAMVSMLVLLGFSSFLILSGVYQLIRDVVGGKAKKRKGLLDDNSTTDGSHSNADFRKMEED